MFDVDKANAGLTRALSTLQLAENEDLRRDPSLFQESLDEEVSDEELSQFEEYAFSVMDEGEALGFDGGEVVETLLNVAHELGLSGNLPVIAGLGEDEEIDDVDPSFFEAAEEIGLNKIVLDMMQEACDCGGDHEAEDHEDSEEDSDDDDSDDDDEDDEDSDDSKKESVESVEEVEDSVEELSDDVSEDSDEDSEEDEVEEV